MGKFADELARYEAGQITSDALIRWVALNINKHDSRQADIDAADRYDEAEREYWRQEIFSNPEPDTTEEVMLAAALLDDTSLYGDLSFAANPIVTVDDLD